jgi:hypothetical protein
MSCRDTTHQHWPIATRRCTPPSWRASCKSTYSSLFHTTCGSTPLECVQMTNLASHIVGCTLCRWGMPFDAAGVFGCHIGEALDTNQPTSSRRTAAQIYQYVSFQRALWCGKSVQRNTCQYFSTREASDFCESKPYKTKMRHVCDLLWFNDTHSNA